MKQKIAPILAMMLATQFITPLPGWAQLDMTAASLATGTTLDGHVNLPNGTKKVSVLADDESLRDVLHRLATMGGFNLALDESVTGNVTISLRDITLNQALEAVATLGDLKIIPQSGGIFLAISREAAQDKGIDRQLSKVIRVNYTNANRIASTLNRSLFMTPGMASGGAGGGQGNMMNQKVTPDPRTNTIIVVGTRREIELAEAAVAKLDIPRQSKTFYLSHANALDVATMLTSSLFNDGTSSLRVGSGSSGSSTSSGGTTSNNGSAMATTIPSTLRVERQDVKEGAGVNDFGSSSGNGTTAGLSSAVTLRGFVKTQDTVSVSPEGALVIPDTRQNAITIMGTAEQIAAVENLLPTLDAQLPQVSIEASLIEITDLNSKEVSTRLGLGDGRLQGGFNNTALSGVNPVTGLGTAIQPAGTGLTGMQTVDPTDTNSFARSGLTFSTNPLSRNSNLAVQVRNLVTQNKAKILANPTIVAMHDTESIISIVDEIVRRVTTTVDESGFATQTVEIGEAGIVMDILPKIGEDSTITMRIRPSVTSVLDQLTVAGNMVTLLSKRDLLTQNVRIRDGETLVIGGLIQESENLRKDKVPLAGDLPIVGAMFRASQRSAKKSELVLLITPHIINNTRLTPVNTTTSMAEGN